MRKEKIDKLLKEGNKIYEKDGYLMYVVHFDGSYKASTNHNFLATKISEELRYKHTLAEAVADMIQFANKYNVALHNGLTNWKQYGKMIHRDVKAEEIRNYVLMLLDKNENIDVDVFVDFLITIIFSKNRKNVVTQFDIPLLRKNGNGVIENIIPKVLFKLK